MGRITQRHQVVQFRVGSPVRVSPDRLLVEEPLEIRAGGASLATVMRTPGNDVELAAGWLASRGVIARREDIRSAIHCASDNQPNTYNVLSVALAPHCQTRAIALNNPKPESDTCGTTGSDSIDEALSGARLPLVDGPQVAASMLLSFPELLRGQQANYSKTGASQAAALFDAMTGELLVAREDVHQANAVDKVVGWALNQDLLPLAGSILVVTGRAGFQIAQRAVACGIPILCALSAPTSLAVELAKRSGLTLSGFLRDDSVNVYAGHDRLTFDS